MALLKSARSAQYPLEAEFVFTFADQMVDINGVLRNFADIQAASIYELIPLPPAATLIGGEVIVDIPFVGGTATTLSVGDSVNGARYGSAISLLAAGRTPLTLTGFIGNGENIRTTFADTVAASTAGKVTVRVVYTVLNRSQEVVIK